MATDNDKVVRLLFPSGIPGEWHDSPDFTVYLAELGSCGVDKLCKEPNRIAEEKNALLEQTQELAFSNYKTFIQTANCSREIFKKFGLVESHLSELIQLLPEFSTRCQQFSRAAQDISSHRRLNSLTLSKHNHLVELLELPQLMDTCVRNGYYDEALELATYTRRLEKKHGSIPIIAGIVTDVQASVRLMLSQLLAQLRTNLQLPACLKLIGYLRRLDAFTEAELRLKFLQARDAWLTSLLQALPNDDPYHHISKTVELTRVHLFDVVTQYRAVFSDEDPLLLPTIHRDPTLSEPLIFHAWIARKISEFVTTLEQDLDRGVGKLLDSLLAQCMYFGLSLGRVGADLRPLLAPLFTRATERSFTQAIQAASTRFHSHSDRFTLLVTDPSAISLSGAQSVRKDLHPPPNLLEFPPLAEFCNGLLSALNEARSMAPMCSSMAFRDSMQTALESVCDCMATFHQQQRETISGVEEDALKRMATATIKDLVPFLQRCLQALFPQEKLADLLGCPLSTVRNKRMVVLDTDKFMELLAELLPPSLDLTQDVTEVVPQVEVKPQEPSQDIVNGEDTANSEEDGNKQVPEEE